MKKNIFSICLSVVFLFSNLYSYAQKQKQELSVGKYNSIEEALKAPEKVVILDLSKQKLSEVPDEIILFTNLQQLNLSNNKLLELPNFITKLPKLSYLNISANKLSSLPQNIGNLNQLSSIDFSKNKISSIPNSFFQLENIEIINCYSNPSLYFEPNKFKNISKQIKYINILNTKVGNEYCQELTQILEKAKIKCSKKCKCQK